MQFKKQRFAVVIKISCGSECIKFNSMITFPIIMTVYYYYIRCFIVNLVKFSEQLLYSAPEI